MHLKQLYQQGALSGTLGVPLLMTTCYAFSEISCYTGRP